MRAHGHDGREPWLHGTKAQENLRYYLKIRYRLFPYIYTTAWQGTDKGIPMMRAMALEYPQNPEAWTKDKQYFFGDWLLVAPALATTTTDVSVWLPEGTWYDFFNPSTTFTGGQTITVNADTRSNPRLRKRRRHHPEWSRKSHSPTRSHSTPLTIDVYPGPKTTSYTLYEDDGKTRNYQIEDAYSLSGFSATRPHREHPALHQGRRANKEPHRLLAKAPASHTPPRESLDRKAPDGPDRQFPHP